MHKIFIIYQVINNSLYRDENMITTLTGNVFAVNDYVGKFKSGDQIM